MALIAVSSTLIILFIVIGHKTYTKFELDWSVASESNMKNAALIKEMYSQCKEAEIYAVSGVGAEFPWLFTGNGIQFLLEDIKVHNIAYGDSLSIKWPDNAIVLAPCVLGEYEGLTTIETDTVYKVMVSNYLIDNVIE